MLKILFIITILVVSIFAKPCMTDIFFGNGVWNTPIQASKSLERLRRFMKNNYNARLERNQEGKTYQFMPPIYNPSRGTIEDVLETFWQLKESGQISEGYFMSKWRLFTVDRGPDELRKAMGRVATTNTIDTNRMYSVYNSTSLSKKHNLLLVAHSQGNLFGNKIYTMLTDAQKQKFRMVSVGTPANHVMKPNQTAPYVTVRDDFVINRVYGALAGNVDGFGHTFIGTYLGSSFEARTKIAIDVKTAYDNLMQTTSCTEYSFVRVLMLSFGDVKIFGRPLGQSWGEEFITGLTLDQYDAQYDANTHRWQCKNVRGTFYSNDGGAGGENWAAGTYKDELGQSYTGMYEWLPARINSNAQLKARSTVKEEVFLYSTKKCVTMSLEATSPLYSALEEVYPQN